MYRRNTQWRNYSGSLVEENKWRAVRYGTDAKLIDFGRREERPFSELIVELVDFVQEASDQLGTTDVVRRVIDIQREGTSAHIAKSKVLRQDERPEGRRRLFDQEETMRGV